MLPSELSSLTLSNVDLPAKASRNADYVGVVHIKGGKEHLDRGDTFNWRDCRALKS
jgi:hypothetical protein